MSAAPPERVAAGARFTKQVLSVQLARVPVLAVTVSATGGGPPGPPGPPGPEGPAGERGGGVTLRGGVPGEGDLPPDGNQAGDVYLVRETGDIWVWEED